MSWLVGNSQAEERTRVKVALCMHSEFVIEALGTISGNAGDNKYWSGVAGSHLWCGLLAGIASTIESSEPSRIGKGLSLFFRSRHGASFDAEEHAAIHGAVIRAWRDQEGRASRGSAQLRRALQIAGVLICPAPEAHQELLHAALVPLVRSLIRTESEQEALLVVLEAQRGSIPLALE
ncbi:hypothetical protein [Microbacterium sp. USTB-Y]|uniref:hypothetical protein n=1 Tax=Microbacterium sp. USTB-Y TaxID=2823692 RepID=UPI00203CC557|nr:hypothetical protein [Microbacterium sp. USTB-Y]